MEEDGTFTFQKIQRKSFFMYPEDALGPCVQSGTIMWEHVESLFHNIRELMRKSGRARTGSFFMPWTAALLAGYSLSIKTDNKRIMKKNE
jgi:hypothetical protein